jgi:hypothetical protein
MKGNGVIGVNQTLICPIQLQSTTSGSEYYAVIAIKRKDYSDNASLGSGCVSNDEWHMTEGRGCVLDIDDRIFCGSMNTAARCP